MAFIEVEFFSHALNMAVTADVVLPQKTRREIGIDTQERPDGTAPVLWLLHGASDDHTIWQRRTSVERFAAPLGLAVVMPAAHLSAYADMAHGGRFYEYIAYELPEIMRGFFPLSARREDNFVAGNSMGGYGAMKIGINNPDRYGAIGCFSAGAENARTLAERKTRPGALGGKRYKMIYGEQELAGSVYDVWHVAEANMGREALPRVFHTCGTDDFLIEQARSTRDFFESLPGNPYSYVYKEYPGIHEWDYWDAHLPEFLAFLNVR